MAEVVWRRSEADDRVHGWPNPDPVLAEWIAACGQVASRARVAEDDFALPCFACQVAIGVALAERIGTAVHRLQPP